MSTVVIAERICTALEQRETRNVPFRHWLLCDTLPVAVCDAVLALPFAPPRIADTLGKRETNNSTRVFFSGERLQKFSACAEIAEAMQSAAVTRCIEASCEVRVGGTNLRIEYCQDTDGFWLEPHTDIGVKRLTMLIYLSQGREAADWGTDIYDGDRNRLGRAPGDFDRGLIFVPAQDTWHGFERREIRGVRRSLIVNYVGPEWRARHELAFPDNPVGGGS